VIFRQFCTPDEEISYLLADPVSRYAAVLDPNIQATRDYLEVLRRLDLRLMHVIETHVHESHFSAAPVLRAETGARLVANKSAVLTCVDMPVEDDEDIYLGEEVITVMATPGHSGCSLSYLWRDRVFTGHTLLAGVTGTCQRSDSNAGLLFESVHDRLFKLPAETLVYPGRLIEKRRISCIGQERAVNTDLAPETRLEDFIARKQAEKQHHKSWMNESLKANEQCMMLS
jgi:sulfur dioxygenase